MTHDSFWVPILIAALILLLMPWLNYHAANHLEKMEAMKVEKKKEFHNKIPLTPEESAHLKEQYNTIYDKFVEMHRELPKVKEELQSEKTANNRLTSEIETLKDDKKKLEESQSSASKNLESLKAEHKKLSDKNDNHKSELASLKKLLLDRNDILKKFKRFHSLVNRDMRIIIAERSSKNYIELGHLNDYIKTYFKAEQNKNSQLDESDLFSKIVRNMADNLGKEAENAKSES